MLDRYHIMSLAYVETFFAEVYCLQHSGRVCVSTAVLSKVILL